MFISSLTFRFRRTFELLMNKTRAESPTRPQKRSEMSETAQLSEQRYYHKQEMGDDLFLYCSEGSFSFIILLIF